jgi:iron complex outermembrane recepter protein
MNHRELRRRTQQRRGLAASRLWSMRRVLHAAALSWLAGGFHQAFAQAPTDSATPATAGTSAEARANDSGSVGIAEIVVTAQRRAQSMQDVPIAVTAVSSAMLETAGIQSTADLQELTPGLTVPDFNGYFEPHIRGVGTSSNGPGIENPIALYIDGVYIASPAASLLSLNNIDRIEVDKGPQGTLFGRNATGGLIQVITRDPQQSPHLDADVSYGNYQNVVSRVYATDGLTEGLSADLAFRYEYQGQGFGRNLYDGSDTSRLSHDLAARSKFLFEPSSATQVRLTLDYEDRAGTRDIFHEGTQYPSTFNNAFFGGPYPQGGAYDVNEDQPFNTSIQSGGAALQINQDLGGVSLESISGYRKSSFFFSLDLDFTPLPILNSVARQHDEQLSQELRVSGNSTDKLKWTAGLYYFYANDGWNPFGFGFGPTPVSPVPDVPVISSSVDDQITNSAAGYGQASYEVLPDTNLTLGGRYTYERKSVDGAETSLVGGVPVAVTPYPGPGLGIPTRATFDKFSYRIALDHKFTPAILGYVSYSTGFKSGGFNLAADVNPPYKPEDIKATEVGLKTELFDRRLRLNVSAFNYLYDDIQVGQYLGDTEIIVNGAKAKMYGADIDGELAVIGGLTFNGGFSYIHDRFLSYPDASFIIPIGGCVPIPAVVPCSGSAAGNKLPYTPTITANVGGDYKWALPFGAINISVNYFRSGAWFAAPDNVGFQPAYDLVNGSLSWTDLGDHLKAGLFVRNLGNTAYATSVTEATPGEVLSRGPPRMYGVTLGYKF